MIQLGSFDTDVPETARRDYEQEVFNLTRVRVADVATGSDKLTFTPCALDPKQPMTVAAVQQALKAAGLFPGARY
jgi:hypothetical protein